MVRAKVGDDGGDVMMMRDFKKQLGSFDIASLR